MASSRSKKVDWTGKTAVVTGAGSGIGRALARALAARGAALALSDIDDSGLAETASMCAGTKVETYHLDVADRDAFLAHGDEVTSTFGSVNLVVNNAGVAVGGSVEETTFEDFDWLLGINLMGVINGSKAFLPHLIASGDGHLVNISSVFGLIAPAYNGAYSTAKFGVRGFTEALRQEMIISGHPVTVHSVHPGGIRTNIARNARLKPSAVSGAGEFEKFLRYPPQKAAAAILAGVDRNRARILVGPDAYVIAALARIAGAAYIPVAARLARRTAVV